MIKTRYVIIVFIYLLSFGSGHIHGLDRTEDQIFDDLLGDDTSKVTSSIDFIKKNRPEVIVKKLEKVLTSKGNNGQHRIAITALSAYPASTIFPVWIEILNNSPSFIVKKEAIAVLAQVNSREIVTPLMEQIKSPFHTVRESAILALKRFRDDRVYAYVLNLAASDNPVFKIYSLEAIYHLYDSRLYNFLIERLKDENKSVRYYTLQCLEKNELAKSVNHISGTALSDKNSEVRVMAIEILGNYRQFNPLSVLLRCVDDPHRDIRYASISAIRKRKFTSTASTLSNQLHAETQEDIKNLIMNTFVEFHDGGGFKGLSRVLLEDRDPGLRINAAFSIGEIRSARSLPYLLDGLKDADFRVKAEVCNSLKYFRENRVVENLIDVMAKDDNPYVRSAALYSINHLRLKNAVLPLFHAYTVEKDVIFRELLRKSVVDSITHFIH